jgi:hypothetical protein
MTTLPMTTLTPEQDVIEARGIPTSPIRALGMPWAAGLVGAAILALAYLVAGTNVLHWARNPLYWLGILIAFLPGAFSLIRSEVSTRGRASLIVLLGIVTLLPKIFHGSGRPLHLDEMMHWYQANQIAGGASLFHENPIVIALGHYPGFEAVVVALHATTGMSTWVAGFTVVAVAHVALLFGVWTLARELTGSPRVAATATALYAAAPALTSVTVLVAYESLGLPLMVWALVFAVKAAGVSPHWIRFLVAAFVASAAVVVTHQLSTIFLMLFLAVFLIAGGIRSIRGRRNQQELLVLGGVLAFTLAFNIVWVVSQDWDPTGYLLPTNHPVDSLFRYLTSVGSLISGAGGAAHIPFEGSGLPIYERIAGFLAPVIITGLCAVGLLLGRSRIQRRQELPWALAALWVLYAGTFLGVFNGVAGSWVHRPWPYLCLGLVILAAAGFHELLARIRQKDWTTVSNGDRKSLLAFVAVLASLAVLFMGNTANDSNDQSRFAGPWVAGAGTRSTTPEMLETASWLQTYAGDNARILADRDTEANMLAYANAYPVQHINTWELTETSAAITAKTLGEMYALKVGYVIVDQRMATDLNIRGYWYGGTDPQALTQVHPFPIEAVTKLAMEPWATQVHQTDNLRVYAIDPTRLAEAYAATQ